MIRQVRIDSSYFPNAEQDGDGNAKELGNLSAKTIEFWINVTGLGASGDYDLNIQTSVLSLDDKTGSGFSTQETINITATGLVVIVINRIDHALGQKYRVNFVQNTTTITLDIKTVILE